jgi:serine/threonine protein kinase
LTSSEKKKVQRPKLKKFCISNCIFEVYDRYEITNYIGRGGYGIVCEAYDHVAKRKVAIKKVVNLFSHSLEFQKRILREIKILRHFRRHDNIICLFDLIAPPSFEKFSDVYIVMEYMDINMQVLLSSDEHFPDKNIQYFLYHILRGVKYLHSANVLHRDLVSHFQSFLIF